MKKFISIFAILLLAFSTISFSVFAAGSPQGDKKVKVEITNNIDEDDKSVTYIVKGEDLKISINEEYISDGYKFIKWKIVGDYEIISGTLTSKSLVIKPLSDVKVTQLFDIEGLEEEKPDKQEGESNKSDTSPETANRSMLGLIAGAFVVSAITLGATKKIR